MKWLEKYADYAYALLRIVTGFIFSFHGAQKILGVFSQFQPPPWSQLWFGGIIELVCGLMVLLGFQTRAAAFLSQRHDGRGLYSVSLEVPIRSSALPGSKQRRVGSSLQSCFPPYCLSRRGQMEPGQNELR